MKLLERKVAIVTGAGRGIGRAQAMSLAAAGAAVVVNDLGGDSAGANPSDRPAGEVADEIKAQGGTALPSFHSVADFASARELVNTALERFGRLDIIVNNAGVGPVAGLENHTEEDFDRIIAVHLKGTFNLCRHGAPVMKAGRFGRIINTASNQWNMPTDNHAYAAAKGGIVSLTWSLAWELGGHGITVNAIAPFAATRMSEGSAERYQHLFNSGQLSAGRYKKIPERPDPSFIAPFVTYLASDEAEAINGRVFRVGGGKIALYSHPQESFGLFRDWKKEGPWPIETLQDLLPTTLFADGGKAPHL